MRKYLYLFIIALTFVACAKNEELDLTCGDGGEQVELDFKQTENDSYQSHNEK